MMRIKIETNHTDVPNDKKELDKRAGCAILRKVIANHKKLGGWIHVYTNDTPNWNSICFWKYVDGQAAIINILAVRLVRTRNLVRCRVPANW